MGSIFIALGCIAHPIAFSLIMLNKYDNLKTIMKVKELH